MSERLTRKTCMALIVTALVLIIALTMSLTGVYAAGPGTATGKVKSGKGVILRKSASDKGAKVAALANNSSLIIKKEVFTKSKKTAKKYRWYQVTASNGKSGYIRSDKVKITKFSKAKAKTTGKVTYRSGAGSKMKKKGKYSKGKTVTIVLKAKAAGSKKTWYKIKKGTKYYFIPASNLSFVSTADTKTVVAPATNTNRKLKKVKTETAQTSIGNVNFTLSEVRYPEIINEGCAFGITGLIVASENIQSFKVGVTNSAGNWVIAASKDVNSTTANIFDLDSYVKFGTLPVGTYTYKAVVTINGTNYTPISRSFSVVRTQGGQKITDTAFLLAWPLGTSSSTYKYGSGRAKPEYKDALDAVYPGRKWGPAPQVGASCDVFVGTVVRFSGIAGDCPRGLDEQFPYFSKSTKFRRVDYSGNKNELMTGDIILYSFNGGGHTCIYVVKDGKAYIAEASYRGFYGRIDTDVNARTSYSGKKALYVYRAVE